MKITCGICRYLIGLCKAFERCFETDVDAREISLYDSMRQPPFCKTCISVFKSGRWALNWYSFVDSFFLIDQLLGLFYYRSGILCQQIWHICTKLCNQLWPIGNLTRFGITYTGVTPFLNWLIDSFNVPIVQLSRHFEPTFWKCPISWPASSVLSHSM